MRRKRAALLCSVADCGNAAFGTLKHLDAQTDRLEQTLRDKLAADYRFDPVLRLRTNDASSAALDRELQRLAAMGALDDVLVYLAGHGHLLHGELLAFMTRGSEKGHRVDEILTQLRKFSAANKFVLLDFCHAGAAIGIYRPTDWAASHSPLSVVAATTGQQLAEATGPFTEALIEAFMAPSSNLDGIVHWKDVVDHIHSAMRWNTYSVPVDIGPPSHFWVPLNSTAPAASPEPPSRSVTGPGIHGRTSSRPAETSDVRTQPTRRLAHPHKALRTELLRCLETDVRAARIFASPGNPLEGLYADLEVSVPKPWRVVSVDCRVGIANVFPTLHQKLRKTGSYDPKSQPESMSNVDGDAIVHLLDFLTRPRLLIIFSSVDHLFQPEVSRPTLENCFRVFHALTQPPHEDLVLLSGVIAHEHRLPVTPGHVGSLPFKCAPLGIPPADDWDIWAHRRIEQAVEGRAPFPEHAALAAALHSGSHGHCRVLEDCLALLTSMRSAQEIAAEVERHQLELGREILHLMPSCCRSVLVSMATRDGQPRNMDCVRCLVQAGILSGPNAEPLVNAWLAGWTL